MQQATPIPPNGVALEIEATHNNWGIRELQHQINRSFFERLVLSKDKKRIQALARKGQIVENEHS